jgi:Fe2+ transport system protein FeoA
LIDLSKAPCHLLLEIKSFSETHGMQSRLESVGIRKGRRVTKLVCQPFGGPVVLDVNGSRISLGRKIASKIDVEVVHL